jgi:flavin-dependent dehydrogenase
MLFAKASVFFLFRQIFTVERRRRIAIWAGLVATFLQSAATVAFQSYTLTPDPGKTWDDAALNSKAERMGGSWWIANAALYIALDLYVLLLPLPIIVRLNWSTKKRLKALAVFSTGLL